MAVLITGAATAEAHRLNRALRLDNVVFADNIDLPQMLFKETKFLKIPHGDSSSFAHQLLALALDHQVDLILPLRKDELHALAPARKLFDEYGIKVIVPAQQVLNELLPSANRQAQEFLILFEGLILNGRVMELIHLPADTGIFSVNREDFSSVSLFVAD